MEDLQQLVVRDIQADGFVWWVNRYFVPIGMLCVDIFTVRMTMPEVDVNLGSGLTDIVV